jgi:hypothetical protein
MSFSVIRAMMQCLCVALFFQTSTHAYQQIVDRKAIASFVSRGRKSSFDQIDKKGGYCRLERPNRDLFRLHDGNDESDWPSFVGQNMTALKTSFNQLDNFCDIKYRPVALARWLSNLLRNLVISRTTYISGLNIVVLAARNLAIARGRVNTIEMKFDKIIFNDVHVSGGGRLIVKHLNLRMRRFLFRRKQSIRKPYLLYCDLLLTQLDIIKSTFIRGLIQLLVDTILARVFDQALVVGIDAKSLVSASINKVTIRARRIHAQGTAQFLKYQNNGIGSVDFEISTGAGIRGEGQVLYLRNINVSLNPNSAFPTDIPILTTAPVDNDLGDDFRIESLVIANKNIWIRAACIISPMQPFAVVESSNLALYKFDLSALLSSLLQLTGGIAVPWWVRYGPWEQARQEAMQ